MPGSERAPDETEARARARFGLPPSAGAHGQPLAGDAGSRRYLRIGTARGGPVLLVLYPEPDSASQANWTALAAALSGAGVRVPAHHDDAPDLGAALVEDLGDRDLASELTEAPREGRPRLLDEAEDLLLAIRTLPRAAATRNPPFDALFFAGELAHTRLFAFERGGDVPLAKERAELWDRLALELAAAAANPSATGDPVPTHRDYHANNLMRAPDGRLAPIDFQDLRLGPPDYDPVSLRFERAGEMVPAEGAAYSEAVVLQRAWKVYGTFEKMLLRGRAFYRPHRDAATRVLRRQTSPRGPWAPLLDFLPAP